MRLKDKIAIITGGGRGIGEATCLRFAEEGAKVVVVDKNGSDVNTVVEKIKKAGGEAIGKEIDVTNRQQVDKMIGDIVSKYGRIDIFINNAGITADAKLEKMTEQQWDQVIDVNLKGVFNCAQGAAKIMKEQNGGVLLNTSSVVGIYGNFGQTNYAASKWGVIGMTKTWAKELGKYNIRVNAVAPGFTLTAMVKKMPEKVLTKIRDKSPLKKLAQPIDMANAFLFLASDEARFITGTVLSVDGGVVL
ncbi:3-oxoacyl-ACP reductase FabG [Crassaminicella profunda]|uniref:3-oxoacyl-ACP reductase FabG n=1 Tax=Crassaminicella profunda TaxID=1286698 RepID=UPI001CA72DC7|nr:3-oxoacyl-ACP reductase FabG [Crassaminicella profunda]QZY55136.1 3-oxoacyl-ACP reductase FabG [Crassaminicella profunda]